MSSEWIVYSGGTKKHIIEIYNNIDIKNSDFEWKISESGNILYFRPKSKVPDFMTINFLNDKS